MIIIIGAGISGLALAYELQKRNKPFLLIDKSKTVGGYIKTINQEGYQLELGPNSLLADEGLMSFLSELDLEKEIVYANDVSKARFIFKKGKYRKLPSGPLSLITGSFFSISTKISVFREFSKPANPPEGNETLADFFTRRFNKEVVDYALDPFVSGIYAGDVEKLLISTTFPTLLNYEKTHGSVLKGFVKNSKGVARKKSLSFKRGMTALPNAIADKINHKNLKLDVNVTSVVKSGTKWLVTTNETNIPIEADKVVFSTPSFKMNEVLRTSLKIDFINDIRYAPMCVVHTVYKKDEVKNRLNGFGGLNPTVENQFTLGSLWTSSIFEGRCSKDKVIFTTFVGGEKQKHKLIENEPWQIKLKVHQELARNFEISSEEPVFQHIYQWERALPQYEKTIVEAWNEANELEKENIFVCANWKDGVSLPDCISKARKLAETL